MRTLYGLFLFLFLSCSSYADSLHFGLNVSNAPPLLFYKEATPSAIPTGGLTYEISLAIAKGLNREPTFSMLPRVRLFHEMSTGHIDLICHSTPVWQQDPDNKLLWSDLLYSFSNVLVSTSPVSIKNIDELKHEIIGTTNNYVYPGVDPLFENKQLLRDDSFSIEQGLFKLLRGRFNYMIMSEYEFAYYKQLYPQIYRSSFFLSRFDIRCALSKEAKVPLKKLNEVIAQLKSQHFVENTLKSINVDKDANGLRYLINTSYSVPYVYVDSKGSGGILKEFGTLLSKELNIPFRWIEIPGPRVENASAFGSIELLCFSHETWYPFLATSSNFNWSEPILRHHDVLATVTEDVTVTTLKDLPTGKIGTTVEYVYPTLQEHFKNGHFVREDARAVSLTVEKLLNKQVKYAIMDSLQYDFFKRRHPKLKKYKFEIDPLEMKCAISKKSAVSLAELNEAIATIRKKNKIEALFNQELARP